MAFPMGGAFIRALPFGLARIRLNFGNVSHLRRQGPLTAMSAGLALRLSFEFLCLLVAPFHYARAHTDAPGLTPPVLGTLRSKSTARRRAPLKHTAPMIAPSQSSLAFAAGSDVREQSNSMDAGDNAGMNMSQPATFIEEIVEHTSSGTSAQPDSTPMPMLMTAHGAWQLMFHGVAFLNWIGESGPRGRDQMFSTNWMMPMAQRRLGAGTLTLRAMLSLEPLTVTRREYPELFQIGETAYGKPISDGQHPHDFFMELSASYDRELGKNALVSFYVAPVGDPAMGPTAYPHRASAGEDPIATLGHHLEDSTHIADDVITAGVTYRRARLEVSGFHGREPDEFRWNIDSGKIDSWSTRLTVNPAKNWSAQYSLGLLKSPEALSPDENTLRMTASVMYNRPIAAGNWASTLIWGRNRTQGTGEVYNGYLAESTLRFRNLSYLWGRIENVDRTNVLLLGGKAEPEGFQEHFLARVQAYTMGFDRDIHLIPQFETALGAQFTLYRAPAALEPIYGAHPRGVVLLLRLRPARESHRP
jgi:hypothetical protein